ncbi:MAG: CAP domain-containing protein [Planctomycetes bacterium]|nr:CAP domain-containing protein [Planctomycetota bacterium]
MFRLLRFGCIAVVAGIVALSCLAPVIRAQDDDGMFEELRKKKAREKAIKEGKDPDAIEPTSVEPAKPKLPETASGWISTIKRLWDSDKPAEIDLVNEAFTKLKETVGTDADLQAKVAKTFDGFKEAEAEKALAAALTKSSVTVDRLRGVLDTNRPLALKAISNPLYTESDGCKLQPQVDEACKPLFQVWRDPVTYSVEKFGLNIATPADKLTRLTAQLSALAPGLEKWPEPAKDATGYMRAKGAEQLDIKKKEYDGAKATLEANEKLEGGLITDEDKRHVRVLNDYRLMLGRNALSINLQLVEATTKHSQYQEKLGRIAHVIDGHPDGRTPQDRARKAGFGGSVAENVLMGAKDGDAAVWQWYNAAEHHRNMIAPHTIIGVGHSGIYWTQNFSGGAAAAPPPRR